MFLSRNLFNDDISYTGISTDSSPLFRNPNLIDEYLLRLLKISMMFHRLGREVSVIYPISSEKRQSVFGIATRSESSISVIAVCSSEGLYETRLNV